MIDHIIELDSPFGCELGFTSDRFDGYLWRMNDTVIISFIASRKRGNFRDLVSRILKRGLAVKVPTPLGRMEAIVRKNGYEHSIEPFSDDMPEPCDMWTLNPTKSAPMGGEIHFTKTGDMPHEHR